MNSKISKLEIHKMLSSSVPLYDKDTGELNISENEAVRLTNIGFKHTKYSGVVEDLIPERKNVTYALPYKNWRFTFTSLTGKDPYKVANYKPKVIKIPKGTMVADMSFFNTAVVCLAREEEDRMKEYVQKYRDSIKPYNPTILKSYRLPELLIPKK